MIIVSNEGWDGYLGVNYKTRLGKYLIRNVLDDNDEPVKFSKDQMLAKVKEISGIDLTDVGPSHYDRDLMKEEDEDDDLNEENFGRESRGDFLRRLEGPTAASNFGYLLVRGIKFLLKTSPISLRKHW